MGHILLGTAGKDMIVKNICTPTPTTASNVIIGSVPKIICEPCFAGGVTEIADNKVQGILAVARSMTLDIPNCAI